MIDYHEKKSTLNTYTGVKNKDFKREILINVWNDFLKRILMHVHSYKKSNKMAVYIKNPFLQKHTLFTELCVLQAATTNFSYVTHNGAKLFSES